MFPQAWPASLNPTGTVNRVCEECKGPTCFSMPRPIFTSCSSVAAAVINRNFLCEDQAQNLEQYLPSSPPVATSSLNFELIFPLQLLLSLQSRMTQIMLCFCCQAITVVANKTINNFVFFRILFPGGDVSLETSEFSRVARIFYNKALEVST